VATLPPRPLPLPPPPPSSPCPLDSTGTHDVLVVTTNRGEAREFKIAIAPVPTLTLTPPLPSGGAAPVADWWDILPHNRDMLVRGGGVGGQVGAPWVPHRHTSQHLPPSAPHDPPPDHGGGAL
jgi:hypothetical protein